MPKLGLTMTEGTLAEWTLAPGARFKAGDCVFVVENDKSASEIAAEHDGVMGTPLVAVGQTVAVGTVLGHWDDDQAGAAALPGLAPAVQAAPGPQAAANFPTTSATVRMSRSPGPKFHPPLKPGPSSKSRRARCR